MNKATEAAMVAGTAVGELAGVMKEVNGMVDSFKEVWQKREAAFRRREAYQVKWQYTYSRMLAEHKTVNGKARPGDLARPACNKAELRKLAGKGGA